MTKLTYSTEKVYITLDPERKEIYMRDKTDFYNETSGYNQKKRGFKKAYEVMQKMQSVEKQDQSTFSSFRNLFDSFNLGMRTYCAMD